MKKLQKLMNGTLAIFVSFMLFAQTPVSAVTVAPAPLAPSATLATAANTEIDRRLAEMAENQAAVRKSTVLPAATRVKMSVAIEKVELDLKAVKRKISIATTEDKVKAAAVEVDASFGAYKATNQIAKVVNDLEAQKKLSSKLTVVANTIQETVDTAKSQGATHINAGVGGLIPMANVQDNLNQLKENLKSNEAVTNSVADLIEVSDTESQSTIPAAAFGQLGVSQSTLANAGTGLSQMSNLTTGGAVGLSVCGIASNCAGQTNNGIIQACGIASDCSNSTNNGVAQTCGVASDCSNSTNNGAVQTCGVASNCKDSTNNGIVQTCGVASDCSNSTNNGLFMNCGVASDCSNSTNNGSLFICGVASNCSNSTNNGSLFICGVASDCSGTKTDSVIFICGIASDCSTTIVNNCEVPPPTNSDGEPITQ